MTADEKNLIYLLRCSLWGKRPTKNALTVNANYDNIISLAYKQTVQGLVSKSLYSLVQEDDGFQHTNKLSKKLLTITMTTVRDNKNVDKTIAYTVKALHERGLCPILLKGKGAARNYLYPELRVNGDIDLYMGNCCAEQAVEILKPYNDNADINNNNSKHFQLNIRGIEVEIHNFVINKDSSRSCLALTKWAGKELSLENCRTIEIGGEKVWIPSAAFCTIFTFYHLWYHFIHGGVGLRQICDWACILDKYYDQLDVVSLEKILKEARLFREWMIFGSLVVDYLGLKMERMPFYNPGYRAKAKKLLEAILWYGNFGEEVKKNFEKGLPKLFLAHKLYTLHHLVGHWRRTMPVSPHETCHNIELALFSQMR